MNPIKRFQSSKSYDVDSAKADCISAQNKTAPVIVLPPYSHVNESERQVILEKWRTLRLQSGDEAGTTVMMKMILKFIEPTLKSLEKDSDWITEYIEAIMLTFHFSKKCVDANDYINLAYMSYRIFTGKSATVWLNRKLNSLFTTPVQGSSIDEVLKTLRTCFDTVEAVQDSPLIKRLVSIYSYLLVHGFLSRIGLTLNDEDYSKMEQRALLSAYSSKKNFLLTILETTLFICERIQQWRATGTWSVFLQSESVYNKWLEESNRLLNLAPFLSNLSAHGTSYFSFLSDLNDAIEKGEAYCKFSKNSSGVSPGVMALKLNALKLLKNTEITRKAAQQERQAPFGVLVYGASSIAKSAFTKMLFSYYGALFNLDRDDHYRYVRNPMDEYWSNFDSSKWCIQLDDIAFLNPAKTSDVDKTLEDLLNVVNNVPYVPPQAALEDKGKTPVMAKLVIATTNCIDLNAKEYFHCPLAVRRRLPYVITLKPKQEFIHSNGKFIDPSKIKIKPGKFPDLWVIQVQKLCPIVSQGKDRAVLELVKEFHDVDQFLAHFGHACKIHAKYQEKAMHADDGMKTIDVCHLCYKPHPHVCELHPPQLKVQATDETESVWFYDIYATQPSDEDTTEPQNSSDPPWYRRIFESWVDYCIQWQMLWNLIYIMSYFRAARYVMAKCINATGISRVQAKFFALFIGMDKDKIAKRIAIACSVIGACVAAYKVANYMQPDKKSKTEVQPDEPVIIDEVDKLDPTKTWRVKEIVYKYESTEGQAVTRTDIVDTLDMQGNMHGTTEEQYEKETRANVWYNPQIELTRFDLPVASASLVTKDAPEIRDLFGRNCVRLHIRIVGSDSKRVMRGVFWRGHQCITNAHAFKKDGDIYDITVIRSNNGLAVNSNITVRLKRSDISFAKDNDLCVFEVLSIPPFKDLSKFWLDSDITHSSGLELIRNLDGTLSMNKVFGLQHHKKFPVESLNGSFEIIMGVSQNETEDGMCGSLYVATTPRGPALAGLHFLGKGHQIGFLSVRKKDIEELTDNPILSQRPVVQSGTGPKLSCSVKTNVLIELHHKSILRYFPEGHLNVYGSFVGFRPRPKSTVCPTPLHEEFLNFFGVENEYGRPSMSGFEPWRKNVIEMVQPNNTYDKHTLKMCIRGYVDDILKQLPHDWEKELVTLSDKASVNGLPGVMYIDRIATGTSMGHPWSKAKKEFLFADICEKYPEGVNFEPEIWERVRAIEATYSRMERAYPVFTGHLKDVATPLKQCAIHKTRLFTGAPADWSLVVRKNLLPFVRLLQKNKFVFEAGPGTITQSVEWSQIYGYLTCFGTDQIVAGDYGKYDKRMLADFILAAFEVIFEIYIAAGFTRDEASIVMCIGEDTAFPMTNINGDLVEFFGTNPSGHPLTVIINSLVNSLYMRYCYATLNPEKECATFKSNVRLFTYGDDNIMGVRKTAPWFNHTDIAEILKQIGVEYTMADKESVSVPYVSISDVSFLKRTWRWEPEVQNWAAPLDEKSIVKSLTMWVPSSTDDKYKQMVKVMQSANSEYFFYGREKFEKMHTLFKRLSEQIPYCHYVTESTFPNFDQLVERFQRSSEALLATQQAIVPGLSSPDALTNVFQKINNDKNSKRVEEITKNISPLGQLRFAAPESNKNQHTQLEVQSGDVEVAGSVDSIVGHTETHEVLTFSEQNSGILERVHYAPSSIADAGATENTSLMKYLSRPTRIGAAQWDTTQVSGVTLLGLNPWHQFLSDPIILNKLRNYAFIRATLCMKFVISATPFHFGLVRFAYEPNVSFTGGDRTSKIRTGTGTGYLVPYSQLPGTWIYPADNTGGEIRVPYFRHTNWLPLGVAADAQNMGRFTGKVVVPLQLATSSGSAVVTVEAFAWLEDVQLCGSTNELVLQARDEYDGPISAPATAIARMASYMSEAPFIGRFARATEVGAGAIASIAGMFGYTNVPNISTVNAVVPIANPHLSTSEISIPFQKLTLDPKQELSIDPSLIGLSGEDEMSISNIITRKSYLTQALWSTGGVSGDVLFNANVSPALFVSEDIQIAAVTKSQRVYHTPMSYVGALFTQWRGDIIFEIDVICTKFHKGRLQISWDPVCTTGSIQLPQNGVYTNILDIGVNNKAVFRVPYHQAREWLRLRGVARTNWNTGGNLPASQSFDNGLLQISILNPLMSPVSPQNVSIIVSVYAADNLEFANPCNTLADNFAAAPPSFFAVQSADVADIMAQEETLGDVGSMHPNRYALNFGECIKSLRTLAHRMSIYDTTAVGSSNSTKYVLHVKSYTRLPPSFGYDPNGKSLANKILNTPGTAAFNYTPTHPMTWISEMYGAMRGSVNYAINMSQDLNPYIGDIRVQRMTDDSLTNYRRGVILSTQNTGATGSESARYLLSLGTTSFATAGAAFTNTQTNGAISWNTPHMTGANFTYPDTTYANTGNASDDTNAECTLLQVVFKQTAAAQFVTDTATYVTYAGAGPDWHCVWWLCCPTVDYYVTIPTSA